MAQRGGWADLQCCHVGGVVLVNKGSKLGARLVACKGGGRGAEAGSTRACPSRKGCVRPGTRLGPRTAAPLVARSQQKTRRLLGRRAPAPPAQQYTCSKQAGMCTPCHSQAVLQGARRGPTIKLWHLQGGPNHNVKGHRVGQQAQREQEAGAVEEGEGEPALAGSRQGSRLQGMPVGMRARPRR